MPGDGPTFSEITANGYKISWTAASDSRTKAADLEYRLVSAAALDELDTLSEALAISGTGIVMDWTQDELSKTVSDISPTLHTAYAVLVRDERGNVTIYPPRTVSSETIDAAVPGTLSFSEVTENSLKISWEAASSPKTAQENLEYRVVIAGSIAEIDTVAEVLALPQSSVLLDWTKQQLSLSKSGLKGNTGYAFTVLVRTDSNNITMYKPALGQTGHYRLIFKTSALYHVSEVVSTANADALCNLESHEGRRPFKALLASTDRTACQTQDCNANGIDENIDWVMEPNRTYENSKGQTLWTTNAAGIVSAAPHAAVLSSPGQFVWTGLDLDWTRSSFNCSNWSSTSSSDLARLGLADSLLEGTWAYSHQSCEKAAALYCVEQ